MQEKDLVDRCEIVLVYLKPGVFGQLHKIRPPTATIATPNALVAPLSSPVIPQNADLNKHEMENEPTVTPVITEGTVCTANVSTGSAPSVNKNNSVDTALPTPCLKPQNKHQGPDLITPVLPDINIFMTQHCSIPLIRCDYESALKAAYTHQKETSREPPKESDTPSPLPTSQEQTDENTSGVCTSGRTQTVIDYKQFLEEYADVPPSPPKRRSEVDLKLKRRPSKQ